MNDSEVVLAEMVLGIQKLTAECANITAQLAEANKFLREAHVMLVRAQGIPAGVPLIGEK